jgi:hypothetical protein
MGKQFGFVPFVIQNNCDLAKLEFKTNYVYDIDNKEPHLLTL